MNNNKNNNKNDDDDDYENNRLTSQLINNFKSQMDTTRFFDADGYDPSIIESKFKFKFNNF